MTYLPTIYLPPASQAATQVLPVLDGALSDVEVDFQPEDRTFWCFLRPRRRPSFTLEVLDDLQRVQRHIAHLAATRGLDGKPHVGWVVLGSRTPGIFNLGGDLDLFACLIRARDEEALRRYAYACVEVSHANWHGYGGRAITVGLAQGNAFGGGFESLLSCNLIVAERSARFALPEVIFGLFPGMGAHLLLAQRLTPSQARRLIVSGQTYDAATMHEMGIVDVLADDGRGEEAVRGYIQEREPRHRSFLGDQAARRVVHPVDLHTLRAVADVWVEHAMELSDRELRRMAHLTAAQDRRAHTRAAG